jgi:hypothetical protein
VLVKQENVSKESEMATPYTLSPTPEAATPALFSFALLCLCAGLLEEASLHFDHPLCALASEVLKYVPSIILELGQTLGSYVLDHAQIFGCFETLLTFWSMLPLVAGAA